MKVVYSNSLRPTRSQTMAIICLVLAIALLVLYAVFQASWGSLIQVAYFIFYAFSFWFIWKSYKCAVDEEKGEFYTPERKAPVPVREIAKIEVHRKKNGKIRYLLIRTTGVFFTRINLSSTHAQALVEHLTRLNPSIAVVEK